MNRFHDAPKIFLMSSQYHRLSLLIMHRSQDEGQRQERESDSDFSDLELDDVVAIKLRARTPPWQKVEQSQW